MTKILRKSLIVVSVLLLAMMPGIPAVAADITDPVIPEPPSLENFNPVPDTTSTTEQTATGMEESASENTQPSNLTGQESNGNVGDTTITTEDSTNTATITTTANSNQLVNGTLDQQSTSADSNTTSQTTQSNQAIVTTNAEQTTGTGQNSASQNVGDSIITTGNANTTGTVITSVNSNIDALAIADFNISDDQTGDLVLDFAQNCIAGCQPGSFTVANSENGSGSANTVQSESSAESSTFQSNDAIVSSNLDLSADSGNNLASQNTGGDSVIQTGNANVAGNAITLANNNLSGNIQLGVVNIFGKLVGDIILPDPVCESCSESQAAGNTGNGSYSTNFPSISQDGSNTIMQNNTASINNNLDLVATTGDNQTSRNTGGNSDIITGDADVQAKTLNVANSNIESEDSMWLVIVNTMGEWIGKIIGAPPGSNFAGSSDTEFTVNSGGEITATNSGNGSSSQNTAEVSQTSTNTTIQNNSAQVSNNLRLSANTGENRANDNTSGASYINTGDAKIIANLINFVNNNIASKGKLVVTVVNVFGTWIGDFVTPGSKKDTGGNGETPLSDSPGETPSNQDNSTSSSYSGSGSSGGDDNNNNSAEATIEPDTSSPAPETAGFRFQQARVAGVSFEAGSLGDPPVTSGGPGNAAKQITLNLAWLLLLLPLAALLFGVKKLVERIRNKTP